MSWIVDGKVFTRRQMFRIPASKVDANLINKNFFIDFAEFDNAWHDSAKADGGDFVITLGDGTTRLAFDLTSYNKSAKTGEGHSKDPSISSSTDNDYYAYCGNPGLSQPAPSDTYGAENVYDANRVVTYHLEGLNDSTSNGFPLTKNNNPSDASGKLGGSLSGGYDFTASNEDSLSKSDETDLKISGDYTLALWFKTDGAASHDGIMVSKGYLSTLNYYLGGWVAGDAPIVGGCYASTWSLVYDNVTDWDDGDWHHLQLTHKGDTVEMWVDGVSKGTDVDSSSSAGTDTKPFIIGCLNFIASSYFNGVIDEVTFDKAGRADEWLTFDNANQDDPNAFFTMFPSEFSAGLGRSFSILI